MKRIGKPDIVRYKAFVWNMIGSAVNAAFSMILTIVATRAAGVEEGGTLGLSFGLSQIFAILAGYEVRTYQATDLEEQCHFSNYLGVRILTCLFASVVSACYVFGFKYTGSKALVIYAICLYKVLEAFADVFCGFFQQHRHLEYAGQALTIRVVLAVLAYTSTLLLTHEPVLAAWTIPVASIFSIVFFERSRISRFSVLVRPKFNAAPCRKILICCFPLFISGFLNIITLNITKLEVDAQAPWLQSYWTPIYMPAFIINLLSIFAFHPMLTTLRAYWERKMVDPFFKTLILLICWILVCIAFFLIGGYWFGIPILEMFYGLSLTEYKTALLIVLTGGGFNALAGLFQCVITIIRAQRQLLLVDGTTFLIAIIITPKLVGFGLLTGAALSYLCSMLTRFIVSGAIVLIKCRREWKSITANI